VDFPIKNGGSFHSYVKVYQRVKMVIFHRFWYLYQRINDEKNRPNRDFSQGQRSGTAAALCCFDAPWPSWTRPTEKIAAIEGIIWVYYKNYGL